MKAPASPSERAGVFSWCKGEHEPVDVSRLGAAEDQRETAEQHSDEEENLSEEVVDHLEHAGDQSEAIIDRSERPAISWRESPIS